MLDSLHWPLAAGHGGAPEGLLRRREVAAHLSSNLRQHAAQDERRMGRVLTAWPDASAPAGMLGCLVAPVKRCTSGLRACAGFWHNVGTASDGPGRLPKF